MYKDICDRSISLSLFLWVVHKLAHSVSKFFKRKQIQTMVSRVPINWVLRKSGNLVFGMFGLIFLYNIRVDVTEHLSRIHS